MFSVSHTIFHVTLLPDVNSVRDDVSGPDVFFTIRAQTEFVLAILKHFVVTRVGSVVTCDSRIIDH